MAAGSSQIPHLNTADLWQRFVEDGPNRSMPFPGKVDDFLVLRLEDYRSVMKLPTPPHRRQVYELLLVTGGSLTRTCDLNPITLLEGAVHLLLANQVATLESLSADVTGYYCHFSLETIIQLYHKEHMVSELSRLSSAMRQGGICLSAKVLQSVKTLFERMLDEYETRNDLGLIDAYLVTLCYELKNDLHAGLLLPAPQQTL